MKPPLRPANDTLEVEALRRALLEAEATARGIAGALRERDEQLRLYAEHSPAAIAMFDCQMRYLAASHRWIDTYRISGESLLGRSHYDVFPEIPQRWRDIHQRCLQGAVEKCDEDPFPRQDGTTDWVRWEVRPWTQADGSVGGIIIFSEEISERKRGQQAVRESEERYRALFEYAPDGIVIADAEGTYLDANVSMCAMLGYSREELVGRNASDIVAPQELSYIQPALQAIHASSDYHRQWLFRRKDQSTVAADVIATQLPDGNILAVVRDVTEKNEAIEAIRTAEERMRFALEAANIGIWDMDYATGVLRWSTILEGHYGLEAGTFPGTFDAFLERVHPDDRPDLTASIGKAIKARRDFSIEHRGLWPDGTVRWLRGAGRAVVDHENRVVRAIGISMDVTERRTLEDQYQQAQKMEAIGRLAGGVAHDFNNLLTAILGYCELLLEEFNPDDPRHADITEIQRASQAAAALTRQLLAFSRRQIIQPVILDLNTVVTDVRTMLARVIGEDISIVVHLSPEVMCVRADRGQMEQILLNLAVNARDAMSTGGTLTIETVAVTIDAAYQKTYFDAVPGPYVRLTVSDTGTGMTRDVQARIFEPFFTTKGLGHGTGLGLATVHGIVAQCQGLIHVYSEVGRGSSFKVYLPAVLDREIDMPDPVAVSNDVAGQGQLVLVVEDAEELRELARRLLERLGYSVVVAGSAADAVNLFAEHRSIQVLLTDVVMPGASGPELAKQLLAERPTLKVIYMSGYTEDAIVHHGILDSGIAFVHKPFDMETLARKLHEALRG